MKNVIAMWNWCNGKKSALGGYVLGLVALLQYISVRYGVALPHADLIVKILTDIGSLLTGVGAAHKVLKVVTAGPQAQ